MEENISNRKILIIDDDLAIRFTLKKLLSKYLSNIELFSSEDGLEGLGYAYIIKPQAIIIDSTLPKYSGRELVDYLTTNEKFKDTQIILLHEAKKLLGNLPANYIEISKEDKRFPFILIDALVEETGVERLSREGIVNKVLNFVSRKILSYSNASDQLKHKTIIQKLANFIPYIFDQFLLSIYLTIFFILLGRKDGEENIEQKKKDLAQYRSRIYPALGLGLAIILFTCIQVTLSLGAIVGVGWLGNRIVNAASYTWDGGGTTNNWSDCDNWSTNVCPIAADNVTFDGTSIKNATIDASWGGTVNAITITSGYTGIITQARSLNLTGAFSQSDGFFSAADHTFDADSSFILNSGATFTASSGASSVAFTFTINSGATFNHNGGTLTFDGVTSAAISCNNSVFNLISFNSGVGKTVNSDCTLPLGSGPSLLGAGVITLNGTLSGSGTLTKTSGAITFNAGSVLSGFSGINTTITVAGATLNLSGYTTFISPGAVTVSSGSLSLPSGSDLNSTLVISGGTFTAPSGTMTLASSLTISSGTFNHNNGTFTFDGSGGTLSCNNVTFNLVVFNDSSSNKLAQSSCNFPLGNNPTLPRGLHSSGVLSGTGTLTASSSTTLTINGTSASLSGFSGLNVAALIIQNNVVLDLSTFTTFVASSTVTLNTGVLSLPSGTDFNGALTLSGGTFNAPSGNMTLAGALTITGSIFNHNDGTITFDAGSGVLSCNNVTFNLVSFTGQSGQKTIGANCSLPVGNNPVIPTSIILNGTLSGTGKLTDTSGTITINSGGTLSGFNELQTAALTVSGGTVDLSSYLSFLIPGTGVVNLSSGSLSLPSGSDLNGALTISGGTFTAPSGNMTLAAGLTISGTPTFNHNNGTITFDAGSAVLSCNNVTFNRVVLAQTAGTKTINSNCMLPLGNNPLATGGASTILNGTLSGTGLLTHDISSTTSTLTLNSTASLIGFNALVVDLLTVAGYAADFTSYTSVVTNSNVTLSSGSLSLPASTDINGGLIISGGSFTAPSGNMTISGALTISGSPTVNHNNGTITFDGGAAVLTCNNVVFNSIAFNITANKTVNAGCNLPIGADPVIAGSSAGRISLNGGSLIGSGVITNNGAFTFNSGATLSGFSGITTAANFTVSGGDMDFGAYTLLDINGIFTLSEGTFTAPSGNMSVSGNFTISGSPTFNHNNGTVTFDGDAATITCNNATFNLVKFAHIANNKAITTSCNLPLGNNPIYSEAGRITVNGSLTGGGLLDMSPNGEASRLVLSTEGSLVGFTGLRVYDLDITGTAVDFSGYSPVSIGDNLDIRNSGSLIAPALMTIGSNFSRQTSGNFIHNNGTVVLTGSLNEITSATNIFYNLSKTDGGTLNFEDNALGKVQTIEGTLTLKGSSGTPLQLDSRVAGVQWAIDPQGVVDIEYLDVQDSNNIGSPIQAFGKNITDGGNNTGWNFDAPVISNFGPSNLASGGYTNSNTPTFNFNIIDPNNDQVKYNIQIDETSDFGSPVIDHTSDFEDGGDKSYKSTLLYDGTYYVRIKGLDSSGGDSGYTNINSGDVAFRIDSLAPTGGILVTDDSNSSNANDVLLILSSSDVGSGVNEMIISENESFSGASYEAYATSKKYTLNNTSATVYVKYKDGAGNESPIYSATIEQTNSSIPISYPEDGTVAEGLAIVAFRLVDRNNNPIVNIPIKLVELGVETTTDENGVAIFENIPLGRYSILGVYNEKEFTQEIEVTSEDKVITIKLEESPNNLTFVFIIISIVLIIALAVVVIYYRFLKPNKKSNSKQRHNGLDKY